jgi:hypothetical protein
MALADLDNVKKRVIRILNANPGAWASTVSGDVGAFPDISEITAAILEADEMVVTKGYFQSINFALCQPYMVYTSSINSGDKLPFFHGKHGKVLLSTDNFSASNIIGIKAQSADDILNILNFGGSYLSADDFNHCYYIDEKGIFYHVTTYGKVEIPTYTRSSTLQAQQSEETLIIATAIRLLTKHATPALFEAWIKESVDGINQLITDGKYTQGVES